MAWRESIWLWTGWGGRRDEPSWRWSMRRMSAKLWRSTANISVHATSKVRLHHECDPLTVNTHCKPWTWTGKKTKHGNCSLFVFPQCMKLQTVMLKPSWRKPSRLQLMMEWCGSEASPSPALRLTSSSFSQVNCIKNIPKYKCIYINHQQITCKNCPALFENHPWFEISGNLLTG